MKKKKKNRKEIFVYSVFLVIAVIGFFIAAPQIPQYRALIENISAGLFVLSIVFFVLKLLSLDQISNLNSLIKIAPRIVQSSVKKGIIDFFYVGEEDESEDDWSQLIKNAKGKVDVLAVAMHTLSVSNYFIDNIIDKIKKNKKFKFRAIVIHPDSDEAFKRHIMDVKFFGEEDKSVKKIIEGTLGILEKHEIFRTTVKLHELSHTCDILRVDDKMYVTNRLAGDIGNKCPCFILENKAGGFFENYVKHFEALWKDERSVIFEEYLSKRKESKSSSPL